MYSICGHEGRSEEPDEYLAAAGDRAGDLRALDKLIRKAAPGLKPYFMVTDTMTGFAYGKYQYKYASGREGEFCAVGLANQKNYMAIYVCVTKRGKYLPEIYAKRLGKTSCGKSCIRFKKLEDLDLAALEKLLEEADALASDTASLRM